jgi:hypothetical protein
MTSQFQVFLCHLCAWVIRHEQFFTEAFLFKTAEYLNKTAWNEGYLMACADLRSGQAVHLTCLERYQVEPTKTFHPACPGLVLVNSETSYEWDRGYERAILLHQLSMPPADCWGFGHFASRRAIDTVFDESIRLVFHGELNRDPRSWRNVKGEFLQAMHARDGELALAYRKYSETVQQIKARYSEAVSNELL